WWHALGCTFAEEGVATPRHPENRSVCNAAGMQVEEVGCAVVGFEHRQVLRAEMRVRLLARKDRKEKRQVGVVRVQQIQLAEVQRIVARYGGEIGVQPPPTVSVEHELSRPVFSL